MFINKNRAYLYTTKEVPTPDFLQDWHRFILIEGPTESTDHLWRQRSISQPYTTQVLLLLATETGDAWGAAGSYRR
jgi:hypothetical protein